MAKLNFKTLDSNPESWTTAKYREGSDQGTTKKDSNSSRGNVERPCSSAGQQHAPQPQDDYCRTCQNEPWQRHAVLKLC